MYADWLKEKFPHDDRAGLYKVPDLPAVKLGRILVKERRISSPNDVVAMHVYGGFFSSGYIIFTKDNCFYDGGSFLLEDVKEFQHKGSACTVFINQKGNLVPHKFKVDNEQVAETFRKLFQALAYYDPKAEKMVQSDYTGFDGAELDWLKLRDEVMRTIDMLHERFNEGKLSLLEYEEKKQQLLSRL